MLDYHSTWDCVMLKFDVNIYARWYIWHATTLHGGIVLVPICKINVKWCLGQQFSWTSLHSSEQLFSVAFEAMELEYNDAMLCFACCVYDLKGICSETQENVISRKINVFDVEYERRTGYGKYKNLLYPQISLYFKWNENNMSVSDPEQLSLPVFLFLMLKMCVCFILFIYLFISIFFYYTIFCAFKKTTRYHPFLSC